MKHGSVLPLTRATVSWLGLWHLELLLFRDAIAGLLGTGDASYSGLGLQRAPGFVP